MMMALGGLPKVVCDARCIFQLDTVSAHCCEIKILLLSSVLSTLEKSTFHFLALC